MQNKLDKYTLDVKNKLNKNFLSPLFIRLANLLYINENYEDCIDVCKTGLEIYPDYLTAKLILIKALLKSEYLNEAEILFNEIKEKIPDDEMYSKLESNIRNLKSLSGQEKIYYPKSYRSKSDFKTFQKNFPLQESLFGEFEINDFLIDNSQTSSSKEINYENFLRHFNSFHFDKESSGLSDSNITEEEISGETADSESIFSRMKIVTETLADIYAEQGNFKEAFEAYNFLLRAGTANKNRIEDKLNKLERNVFRKDGI